MQRTGISVPKLQRVFLWTFVGMGILFMLIGLGVGAYYGSRTRDMRRMEGTVAAFEKDHPVVAFEMNGESFRFTADEETDLLRVGSPYAFMVNPDNPADYMDNTLPIVMWIFAGLGAFFALLGLGISACMGAARRSREALLSYGLRARATVTAVTENKSVSMGNRHPLRVTASCVSPVTGQEVTLRSHNLWTCTLTPGQQVTVAFDPVREKKYAFDLQDEEDASACPSASSPWGA